MNKARLTEIMEAFVEHPTLPAHIVKLEHENIELEADNKRLREALEGICCMESSERIHDFAWEILGE